MKDDTSIIPLRQPGSVEDPLTGIGGEGARRMLLTALEAEIEAFLDGFAEERLVDGRQRVVRHGCGPERRSRPGSAPSSSGARRSVTARRTWRAARSIRFTSHILPKWARRSRSLDALLPVLYLRGISTGDFQDALSAILGAEAPNLSPGVILRRGKKELVGFHVGRRERAQSWRELRVDLKARGLSVAPEVAAGDGALGFWKALDEVFAGTPRHGTEIQPPRP